MSNIVVDIDVWNCEIRAFKPRMQIAMPTDQVSKLVFWNTIPIERLNERTFGHLRGRALRKAEKIVDREGSISMSGVYGSIIIDEKDFVEVKDVEAK